MYPKLISIGSFYIPTYGVLVALGFLSGAGHDLAFGATRWFTRRKDNELSGVLRHGGNHGRKAVHVPVRYRRLHTKSGSNLHARNTASRGVFHGGFIVALLFAVLYMRKQQLPAFKTMDTFAPGVALGQAIGRIGCFAAGCCWGKECYLPWGVRFRSNFAAPVPLDKTLHPVQLYESAADLIIFGILYRQFNRQHRAGQVIGLYLVLYSGARFIIEFFREHEQSLVGPFSLTQWIALGLLALGVGILLRRRQVETVPEQHAETLHV